MQNSNRKCRKDDSSGGNGSETSGTMTSTDFEKPFQRKFPCLPGEENLPCLENDYSRAKAYLMKQCLSSGDNL